MSELEIKKFEREYDRCRNRKSLPIVLDGPKRDLFVELARARGDSEMLQMLLDWH